MSLILTAISPLISIAKLAGLAPFTIDPQTLKSAVTSSDILAICVTTCMHLLFNFVFWRSVLGPDVDEITNDILEVSTPLLLYVDYLINASALFWFFAKRRQLVELLHRLNDIDHSLAMEFGMKLDYKRQRNRIAMLLATTMGIATLINTNDFVASAGIKINSLEFYNLDLIFYFWNALCQLVQFCCFVVGMRGICQRLALVSHCVNDRLNAIRILTKVHLKLALVIEDFNAIFAPILFLHFADIFCWLCFLIFDVVMSSWKNFLLMLAVNIPHAVYMMSFVIVTISSAEGVRREARRCIGRLHEVGSVS